MKIRLISKHGNALGLILRLAQKGHDVDFWVYDKKAKGGYRGIVKQVDRWNAGLTPDMVILFDMVGVGSVADSLKKTHKVYGGGKINDSLELNISFGRKIAQTNGIKLSETNGPEMSVECFYVDGVPLYETLNSTIKFKRFMEGDKGVLTDCMGSVVRFWKNNNPKIYKHTLGKIEGFLKQFKYSGPLSCNCIISEKDRMPHFVSWTARFGYDNSYAFFEGMDIDKFLAMVLKGERSEPSYDWLGAVRMSSSPYPYEGNGEGRPVSMPDSEHIWPLDIKIKDNKLTTAGINGVVCEITGKGKTFKELNNRIYELIEKIDVPDRQYRSDIVDLAEKRFRILRKWKYL
jgi:hypothetical protein